MWREGDQREMRRGKDLRKREREGWTPSAAMWRGAEMGRAMMESAAGAGAGAGAEGRALLNPWVL